ncbi:TBC1 domain family member 13 [Zostera marina]|uniref:TBC1 domain family member 13 n=1 Tax=Zostera marina TaxID=29655 RepID=A0A0K9PIH3_ZOSMR|nr:TBC1 domain family member 13 [Zostera marina]
MKSGGNGSGDKEVGRKEGSTSSGGDGGGSLNLEWKFNQTLRSVQGLLKGRSFPGKVLLTRKPEPVNQFPVSAEYGHEFERSNSESGQGSLENRDISYEHVIKKSNSIGYLNTQNFPTPSTENSSTNANKSISRVRSTDSARLAKFTKELSGTAVILDNLRKLGWNGIPPFLRPNVWRLLLGYASPNSDRRDKALTRKRLEYFDCVSQYHDIPESDRPDDEINMLRQITVDCPRTVPEVTFFQQDQVQKSLECILYTWAIRHPASGYVQGINDLVTPFLVVFLSEHLEGSMDNWLISDISPQIISNVEADCYWCLSKLLDGMQDHYTFAQPGIQRLVFKLKELVRRIDEPVSRHMEEQGLDFLQFSFRWFNCLLIREIPFHLVNRLWDTYLAEGDALPEFLVYITASFLLTWSDKLQKLDFQEMIMFLQHLPTENWTDQELETVLSRAYMWHTMFNNSPSHLAN